jgi:soluble lytic murein transglycosylase-like protein
VKWTRRSARLLLFGLSAWLATSAVCRAELVFLTSGRTLSVKSHRVEGDHLVFTLRAGGEVTCQAALVERIAPDEVPYPEPELLPAADASSSAVPFGDLIDSAAAREGVDPKLVRAVIQVESAYQPKARSRKGAMGLMQLMPGTARQYAVTNPYDPGSNIEAGIKHLKSLLARLELPLALAAYNAGEAAVTRFRGIPPYPETQNYVRQVMRLAGLTASR